MSVSADSQPGTTQSKTEQIAVSASLAAMVTPIANHQNQIKLHSLIGFIEPFPHSPATSLFRETIGYLWDRPAGTGMGTCPSPAASG
jgi:hypothetical protein